MNTFKIFTILLAGITTAIPLDAGSDSTGLQSGQPMPKSADQALGKNSFDGTDPEALQDEKMSQGQDGSESNDAPTSRGKHEASPSGPPSGDASGENDAKINDMEKGVKLIQEDLRNTKWDE